MPFFLKILTALLAVFLSATVQPANAQGSYKDALKGLDSGENSKKAAAQASAAAKRWGEQNLFDKATSVNSYMPDEMLLDLTVGKDRDPVMKQILNKINKSIDSRYRKLKQRGMDRCNVQALLKASAAVPDPKNFISSPSFKKHLVKTGVDVLSLPKAAVQGILKLGLETLSDKVKDKVKDELKKNAKKYANKFLQDLQKQAPEVAQGSATAGHCQVQFRAVWDKAAGVYKYAIFGSCDCDCIPKSGALSSASKNPRSFMITGGGKVTPVVTPKKVSFRVGGPSYKMIYNCCNQAAGSVRGDSWRGGSFVNRPRTTVAPGKSDDVPKSEPRKPQIDLKPGERLATPEEQKAMDADKKLIDSLGDADLKSLNDLIDKVDSKEKASAANDALGPKYDAARKNAVHDLPNKEVDARKALEKAKKAQAGAKTGADKARADKAVKDAEKELNEAREATQKAKKILEQYEKLQEKLAEKYEKYAAVQSFSDEDAELFATLDATPPEFCPDDDYAIPGFPLIDLTDPAYALNGVPAYTPIYLETVTNEREICVGTTYTVSITEGFEETLISILEDPVGTEVPPEGEPTVEDPGSDNPDPELFDPVGEPVVETPSDDPVPEDDPNGTPPEDPIIVTETPGDPVPTPKPDPEDTPVTEDPEPIVTVTETPTVTPPEEPDLGLVKARIQVVMDGGAANEGTVIKLAASAPPLPGSTELAELAESDLIGLDELVALDGEPGAQPGDTFRTADAFKDGVSGGPVGADGAVTLAPTTELTNLIDDTVVQAIGKNIRSGELPVKPEMLRLLQKLGNVAKKRVSASEANAAKKAARLLGEIEADAARLKADYSLDFGLNGLSLPSGYIQESDEEETYSPYGIWRDFFKRQAELDQDAQKSPIKSVSEENEIPDGEFGDSDNFSEGDRTGDYGANTAAPVTPATRAVSNPFKEFQSFLNESKERLPTQIRKLGSDLEPNSFMDRIRLERQRELERALDKVLTAQGDLIKLTDKMVGDGSSGPAPNRQASTGSPATVAAGPEGEPVVQVNLTAGASRDTKPMIVALDPENGTRFSQGQLEAIGNGLGQDLGVGGATRAFLVGNTPVFVFDVNKSAYEEKRQFLATNVSTFFVEEDPCRVKETTDPLYEGAGLWGQDFDNQWATKRVGFVDENLPVFAADSGFASVTVAVIDSGVDWFHPDLPETSLWRNVDEIADNGIDDDGNGYVDDTLGWNFIGNTNKPWDQDGHGTFVSGVIAAGQDNGIGIRGISATARIMPLKALDAFGQGHASMIAEAITYAADNGARVINLSLGGRNPTFVERLAIRHANDNGALVIAAAGNEGSPAAEYAPAGIEGVLTVSATDRQDRRAGFSNWGPAVDLAAPGVDVLSLRARNTDLLSLIQDVDYDLGAGIVGADRAYYRASGTSFAAPIVSATAAVLFSKFPDLEPADVKRMLKNSARDIATEGIDNFTGYGLLDAVAAVEADPSHFIDAKISGVQVVKVKDQQALLITGSADADQFAGASLYIGQGEAPEKWFKVKTRIETGKTEERLMVLPAKVFAKAPKWTLRLVVDHADGRTRQASYSLSLG